MITLLIAAREAENSILDCISSTQDLVSEVIVIVDSRTTDQTAALCRSVGARVFIRDFSNFSDQKNHGNSLAKNDWILSLDADEQVSKELVAEIKSISFLNAAAYSVPRLNYFFKLPIYHTNWGPEEDRQLRLFDKTKCHWEGNVHESLHVSGSIEKLTSNLFHYPYDSVDQFLTKLNTYTSSETKQVFPPFDFFRRYIWHSGFKDAYLGLFLCYLMLIYHTSVWVKLWLRKSRPSSAS